MRVFGWRADAGLDPIEFRHVTALSWTDGIGESNRSFTLTLASDQYRLRRRMMSNAFRSGLRSLGVMIVPTRREIAAPFYGPYEIERAERRPDRSWVVSGRIGIREEETYDTSVGISRVLSRVRPLLGGETGDPLSDWEPYKGWQSGLGETARSADMYIPLRAIEDSTLGGLRQSLEPLGLIPYIDTTTVGRLQHYFRILPLYPVFQSDGDAYYRPHYTQVSSWAGGDPDGLSERLTGPRLRLSPRSPYHAALDAPSVMLDAFNRGDDWRTRRILASHRSFQTREVVFIELGADSENLPIRLAQFSNPLWARRDIDKIRWDLQNSTATVVLQRAISDTWTASGSTVLRPHHIVYGFSRDWLPADELGLGDEWLVRRVDHSWTTAAGYTQTITMTEWRGPFERVS